MSTVDPGRPSPVEFSDELWSDAQMYRRALQFEIGGELEHPDLHCIALDRDSALKAARHDTAVVRRESVRPVRCG